MSEDYEDFDEYNYDNIDDTIEMRADINAGERTTYRNDIDVDYLLEKKDRLFKTSLEYMVTKVNAITLELISNNVLSMDDLQVILGNIKNLDKPEFKNATGYVLGYIASNGGRKITELSMNSAFCLLNHYNNPESQQYCKENKYKKTNYVIEDPLVLEYDVIRYARLWISLK